jgi:hypothetical protein
MHNDSGDTSRIFLVNAAGKVRDVYSWNAKVLDCEDIALNPKEKTGKACIYVGDIGDNGAKRPCISLYRFVEPVYSPGSNTNLENVEKINLKYPDGPRDAETLMIDPIEQLIFIISKREDTVGIYTCSIPMIAKDTIMLQRKANLYLPGIGNPKWVVAGDISDDGKQVILKTYKNVYYWKRLPGEHIWETLRKNFTLLPYKAEPQGEAVCFDKNKRGYFSVSEGENPPIYYYKIPK